MTWAAIGAAGVGAGAGMLASDGGDKFMSMKDVYGKDLKPEIAGMRQDILGMDQQQFYPGQTYADLDPAQMQAYNQMIGFGAPGGFGDTTQARQGVQGIAGLSDLWEGSGFVKDLAGGGGPQFGYDQGTFDTTMQNLMPGLQGAYDESTRDIMRNLTEGTLPGLDMNAALTGNTASTRGGVAEGIATRGAKDRAADMGSQLTQNALNQAQRAALIGGQQNIGADLRTQGNVVQGFQGLANIGLPGVANAMNTATGNIKMQLGGGTGLQQQEQRGITEDVARHEFDQQAPWDLYGSQLDLINSTTPAGMGINPTQQPGPSALDLATQGAQVGMGAYDWFNRSQQPQMAQPAIQGPNFGGDANILNPMMNTGNWGGLGG